MGNYCERLEIRLTLQQKEKLTAIASQQGVKLSQIIRCLIFQGKLPQNRDLSQKTSRELGRIGNNLNQIAKVLNTYSLTQKSLPTHTLLEMKQELNLTINEVNSLKTLLENDRQAS